MATPTAIRLFHRTGIELAVVFWSCTPITTFTLSAVPFTVSIPVFDTGNRIRLSALVLFIPCMQPRICTKCNSSIMYSVIPGCRNRGSQQHGTLMCQQSRHCYSAARVPLSMKQRHVNNSTESGNGIVRNLTVAPARCRQISHERSATALANFRGASSACISST